MQEALLDMTHHMGLGTTPAVDAAITDLNRILIPVNLVVLLVKMKKVKKFRNIQIRVK